MATPATSTTAPTITDVGTVTVLIRATNPAYTPAQTTVDLVVTPAEVVVTARDASKLYGEDDPNFFADVSGVLDDYRIIFRVTRPGAGTDENIGSYMGAIVPGGDELQGNYRVVYVAADFTIMPGRDQTIIDDEETPLSQFFDIFQPKPGRGTPAWALVNLICVIVTAYLFLPLLHLGAKFGRIRRMRRVNDAKSKLRTRLDLDETQLRERDRIYDIAINNLQKDGKPAGIADVTQEAFDTAVEALYYHIGRFTKRSVVGVCLEALVVALSVIAFVLTEDMRLPMILIDKWTPLMILLLLLCWIVDLRLLRYRDKVQAEEETEKSDTEETLR